MASQCYLTGRIDEARPVQRRCQIRSGRGRDALPYGIDGMIGGRIYGHRPARTVG